MDGMFIGRLKSKRRFIFLSVLGLSLFGLLAIYSASCIHAYQLYNDAAFFLKRQILFLGISIFIFFLTLLLDVNILNKFNKEFLIFNIFLLVIVLLIGKKVGGARRWLQIGFFNFQPSELLKISFLLYCADYFVRKDVLLKNFRDGLLPLLLVVGFISSLIILEPDLGAVIFWLIWIFLMLFIVKTKTKHLLFILFCSVLAAVILIKTNPYRFMRIISYLNPWQDPQGSGFQIIQSQIAIGGGGIFGVGLGAGRQKLLFLPAAHTDFIFSIIAEEFGFIGSLSLLIMYFLIFIKMLNISQNIKYDFSRYICLGIAIIFGLEIVINIGVSCGLFPTKGMALPFVSYGGTNLSIHYVLLGIFFNMTKELKNPLYT